MSIALSKPISIYFDIENGGDFDRLSECFTEDAMAVDEGVPWEGLANVRRWMMETRERFRHSVKPLSLTEKDGRTKVTGRVWGAFPYSPVDLDFVFEEKGDKIIYVECPLPADRILAPLQGQRPPAPAWFGSVLEHAPERTSVSVRGARIEALSWGKRGAPGLLLLHERAAHADWWSFIAPYLADRFRITALSWSGMGRSDWRDSYDIDIYADEIFDVAQATGLFDASVRPLVVAHGFGGLPLVHAAGDRGDELGGIVLIDCDFRPLDDSALRLPQPKPRSLRPYASLEKSLITFKLQPSQGCENLFLVDFVGRNAMKHVEAGADYPAGWTWVFDPALQTKTREITEMPAPADLPCPVAIITGSRSHVITPAVKEAMVPLLRNGTPWITIPDANHHVMLDQPLALVSALDGLLSGWPKDADG